MSSQEDKHSKSIETAQRAQTTAADQQTHSKVAGLSADSGAKAVENSANEEATPSNATVEKDGPIKRQDLFVPLSSENTSASVLAAESDKDQEKEKETDKEEDKEESAKDAEGSSQTKDEAAARQKQEAKKEPLTKRQMVRVEGLRGMILEEELRSAFRPYGELGMISFEDPFRDTAIVRFTKITDAANATAELNGKEINNQVVRVSHPDADSVVYVGNLPLDYTEDNIRRWLAEFGSVERILLIRNKDGKSKGYAIVEFKTSEQAGLAKMNAHHRVIGDRHPQIEWFEWRINTAFHSRTVFVDRLSRDFKDEVALKDYFQLQGPVIDCFVSLSSHGNSRRTAYIEFEKEEDAEKAWSTLQDADFHGSKIRLSFCNPMKTVAILRVVLNQPGAPSKVEQSGRFSSPNYSQGGPGPYSSRSYSHSRRNSEYERGSPAHMTPSQSFSTPKLALPVSHSRGGMNHSPYQHHPQEQTPPRSPYGGYPSQQHGSYPGHKRSAESYYEKSNIPLATIPGYPPAPHQFHSPYSYQSPSQPGYSPRQHGTPNQAHGYQPHQSPSHEYGSRSPYGEYTKKSRY